MIHPLRNYRIRGAIWYQGEGNTGQANKSHLQFDHAGGGLTTRDGKAPSHFELAGADKIFHAATALIDGDEVIVSSAKVAEPKAVRYAFTSQTMPNLMNQEGLPASSFRSDNW